MSDLAAETIAAAARFDHPWDKRALDWPLTSESVVVEVGGYKGRWAYQIAERYHPRLYVFEPQPWAYEVCKEVLDDRAHVFNVALGSRSGIAAMTKAGTDGCTIVDEGELGVIIREIADAFDEIDVTRIDLMLMNIEGYEYTLLPHMLDRDVLPRRLMVQFHTFADPSGMQQAAIYEQLAARGYTVAWTYGVVLTAWERR